MNSGIITNQYPHVSVRLAEGALNGARLRKAKQSLEIGGAGGGAVIVNLQEVLLLIVLFGGIRFWLKNLGGESL